MFRYKLRTLLIVLALGPPVLAVGWWYGKEFSWADAATIAVYAGAMALTALLPALIFHKFVRDQWLS